MTMDDMYKDCEELKGIVKEHIGELAGIMEQKEPHIFLVTIMLNKFLYDNKINDFLKRKSDEINNKKGESVNVIIPVKIDGKIIPN